MSTPPDEPDPKLDCPECRRPSRSARQGAGAPASPEGHFQILLCGKCGNLSIVPRGEKRRRLTAEEYAMLQTLPCWPEIETERAFIHA